MSQDEIVQRLPSCIDRVQMRMYRMARKLYDEVVTRLTVENIIWP